MHRLPLSASQRSDWGDSLIAVVKGSGWTRLPTRIKRWLSGQIV